VQNKNLKCSKFGKSVGCQQAIFKYGDPRHASTNYFNKGGSYFCDQQVEGNKNHLPRPERFLKEVLDAG